MILASLSGSLFSLPVPVLEKICRAVLIYAFLLLALRLAGKREMAQLNAMDFIVLLAVANAVQNGIIGNDNSVSGAVLGATVFFGLNGVVATLVFRSHRARKLIEGSATVLIQNGVVDRAALKHERLTEDDLLAVIEGQGADSFDEVATALLEPSGTIVTILKTPDHETEHYLDLKAN